GAVSPADALGALDPSVEQIELRMTAQRVRAIAHLLADSPEEALREIGEAITAGHDRGFRIYEAEALETACDIQLVLERAPALARSCAQLASLGEAMPSARFTCAARFFRTLASGSPDPAALETIAGAYFVAPHLALRARALLGAGVPLDRVDRRVIDALS